jgi:hypothetical protein
MCGAAGVNFFYKCHNLYTRHLVQLIDQLLGVRLMCGTVKKMHKYIFALRLEQHVYSRFLMPLVPKEQVL